MLSFGKKMDDSRDVRLRIRIKATALRRLRQTLATLASILAVVVLLALANLYGLFEPLASVRSGAGSAISPELIDISSPVAPRRPTYGYAVIPGGAWDAQELRRAVLRDAVVADHYRHVDPATMRAETVATDRLAYVSYRVDDRVYWTKRKLLIRNGETILTNGQVEIRSRCGNCISLEPMLPTSDNEPDESQFDALTDEPLLVAWGWGPSVAPMAVSAPPDDPEDILAGLPFGPMFPFGGGSFPGGPVTNVPNAGPPGILPLASGSDSPPPGTSAPPAGTDPPFVGGAPHNEVPAGNASPLVLQALLENGNGSAPPALPPTVPPEAKPVPEPGTLLLFGSGIACLLARRYRSKNT